MNLFNRGLLLTVCLLLSKTVLATIVIPMALTTPTKTVNEIGVVTAQDTQHGLLLTPNLHYLPPCEHGLTPCIHGFHMHEHPSCEHAADAAGGHYDPHNTKKHLGPYNTSGHLGDLPALFVNKDGSAHLPVLAPRLREKDLKGHALMIHAGGDNYSDKPLPLGGGGKRVACGVIK